MIKNFIPQPFEGYNPLPNYVTDVNTHTLIAKTAGGYEITLAKLTYGVSLSAGNPLSHALFESFTDHGERCKVARTRASGVNGIEREFAAIKNAMSETGVEFHPSLPLNGEGILRCFGDWFKVQNPELAEVSVVSQTCH